MADEIFSALDNLLQSTDLSSVTAESNEGFAQLPDGTYFCEVMKSNLGVTKTGGQPCVKICFQIVEDGFDGNGKDALGNPTRKALPGTKGRFIFKTLSLKDSNQIQRSISDLLKFEQAPGEAILSKEMLSTSELMREAVTLLVGARIWVTLSTNAKSSGDGKNNQWSTILSFRRAQELGLNVD